LKEEEAELKIIENYLPEALSTDELENIIVEIIAVTSTATMKDIGKVMPKVMQKVMGCANGSEVQAVVRSKLS
jgi:uncharacterized protein YqeY